METSKYNLKNGTFFENIWYLEHFGKFTLHKRRFERAI